ncbi:unnamed protein product [Chilo suppressalis]|uniref:Uncharacterized protein n=1 Tax=Chilo suppressalis TaxID=168631 RepID=A0ABN8B9U4_CHISP|nr:unnamed protein product [Chilo suppressalis]
MPKTGNLNIPIQAQTRLKTQISSDIDTTPTSETKNVTVRQKRHASGTVSEASEVLHTDNYLTEENLRDILADTIATKVTAQLKSLEEQFNGMRDAVTFFHQKYESSIKTMLEEKSKVVHALECDNVKLKSTVTDLSIRLNLLEQNMRESNIEINGIPDHKAENLTNTFRRSLKL